MSTHSVHRITYDATGHHLRGYDEDGDELFVTESWNVPIDDVHGDVVIDENGVEIAFDEPRTFTVNQENYELIDIE